MTEGYFELGQQIAPAYMRQAPPAPPEPAPIKWDRRRKPPEGLVAVGTLYTQSNMTQREFLKKWGFKAAHCEPYGRGYAHFITQADADRLKEKRLAAATASVLKGSGEEIEPPKVTAAIAAVKWPPVPAEPAPPPTVDQALIADRLIELDMETRQIMANQAEIIRQQGMLLAQLEQAGKRMVSLMRGLGLANG